MSVVHVMTVSGNGQVSLPASVRARWATRRVQVIDLGDRVLVCPVDPSAIERLQGRYAGRGPSSSQARAHERAADRDAPAG